MENKYTYADPTTCSMLSENPKHPYYRTTTEDGNGSIQTTTSSPPSTPSALPLLPRPQSPHVPNSSNRADYRPRSSQPLHLQDAGHMNMSDRELAQPRIHIGSEAYEPAVTMGAQLWSYLASRAVPNLMLRVQDCEFADYIARESEKMSDTEFEEFIAGAERQSRLWAAAHGIEQVMSTLSHGNEPIEARPSLIPRSSS